MIETKKKTEGLLIFTSVLIIIGALLAFTLGKTEFSALQYFGWTIIVASWFEMINSINNHRWPKSNFLITAEFLVGTTIVISSMAAGIAITGIIGAMAIVFGCIIFLETSLWPRFAARFINIAAATVMIVVGIMYMSSSMELGGLILWVLGARAVSNFILSFMEVRY